VDEKALVAKKAAEIVLERGVEVLGVGSGSTVALFIKFLAEGGFSGLAVPTSFDTTLLLRKYNIRVLDLVSVHEVDMSVDGADEVALETRTLIKGGGAAHLREKVIAEISRERIYIVDSSKVVDKPCKRGVPVPLEVVPYALPSVTKALNEMGVGWELRSAKGKLGPLVTDNGNFIMDLECNGAYKNKDKIASLNGVAAIGIFDSHLVDTILVGRGSKVEEL
jgi:ribose 5-phosphate isomerase A